MKIRTFMKNLMKIKSQLQKKLLKKKFKRVKISKNKKIPEINYNNRTKRKKKKK
jgi:hypothetical protein